MSPSLLALSLLQTASGADESWLQYDRGVTAQAGNASLAVGARLQARWTTADSLGIRRARISARSELGDVFEARFQGAVETGAFEVKDLYASAHIVPGWLSVQAGQMKEPFSRQQIASSGKMQFLERAVTDGAFGAGRGIGALVQGGGSHSAGLRWSAGLSSAGDAQDIRPLARLDWDPNGAGFDEVDLSGGPFRAAIGAAARAASTIAPATAQADTQLKWRGFSAASGVYVAAPGDDAAAIGGHLQAGYCLRGRLQAAGRLAVVGETTEQRLAASYFLDGYRFYLQLDGGQITSPEEDLWEVRSQIQIVL